ncbi:hypothetical protein [Sphingomonas sp. TREG-RG-20F-R18-01]|uniref:hypothetical protein n=1 Tax=Sphingomonas sp. TREG-RG-20F-R18-01 TaxID=2914982 RepID=UPI001F565275|nr:hypothetical protein [Sphingomonas sp. TREG-RG-20F-R18-01]
MILEARPLDQLDWSSLSAGPILLLILPQVSVEVDARKRDGRLGERARILNRQLDPSIETGAPSPILKLPVRVDIAYVPSRQIDWSGLDDLEPDSGDDRIVAQALHALVDDPTRLEVMSFDSRPRAAAKRHGLRTVKPAESWLLETEPSTADRRLAELQQRLQLLETTEPKLRVTIRALDAEPLTFHKIAAVPAELIETVARSVLAKHRRQRAGGVYGLPGLNVNSRYDEEYDVYEREMRQRDIPALNLGASRQFSSYPLEIVIENIGALAAQHVTVEVQSGNAALHAKPFFVDLFGPPPPSTERDLLANIPTLAQQLARRDRTSFGVELSEDSSVQVEYRCEDFRHGRSQTLTPVLEILDRTSGAASVEVRVTAGNMRGVITDRLVAAVAQKETLLGDLIDLDAMGVRAAPPTRELILAAIGDDDGALARFRNDGTRRD